MMKPNPNIKIRPVIDADRAFIFSLLPRFAEHKPAWRTTQQIVDRTAQEIEDSFAEGKLFFAIAENERQQPLGLVRLSIKTDYLTAGPCGYVAELAVSPQGEGQGTASALLAVAEGWARSLELELLTLHVFADNHRARRLYESLGYRAEVVEYVKVLGDTNDD